MQFKLPLAFYTGFVQIKNAFSASRTFFEQGAEEKLRYKYEDKSPKGYHGQGYRDRSCGSIFEVRESFDWTGRMKKHGNDQLNFFEELQNLQEKCKPLAKAIFKLIGIGLKLDDDNYFLQRSQWLCNPDVPSFKTFRSLYYPAIPEDVEIPQGEFRVKEHSDFDFLTFLFQDSIGGLEVQR